MEYGAIPAKQQAAEYREACEGWSGGEAQEGPLQGAPPLSSHSQQIFHLGRRGCSNSPVVSSLHKTGTARCSVLGSLHVEQFRQTSQAQQQWG